ncbi:aldose 1-epimerase family protein [Microbacterium sp. P05]|uniref:aldose 1-epimerase family protein n=1 Tax=Microbacterium sp. P05 TaxID=3366948 RepID=UPI003746B105
MSTDPTGHRFTLTRGTVTAEVAQVGAALRALTVDGTDLAPRYSDDSPTPAASGVVLVPWPNRIRDGIWDDEGTVRRLAISEPALGNASHGLLRFGAYTADAAPTDTLTLRADVFPQTGYPYHLATAVTFTLTDRGLHIAHVVQNVGSGAAPVALGVHPYLQIGGVPTADLVIRSSGTRRLVLDERSLPIDERDVDEATDLRGGRRLGDLSLDTAYRGLDRGADGRIRHTLTAPDGRILTLWQGEGFDWAQVFTTDRYPGQPLAVAVEPMTAPADAFNSGVGLRRLAPGEEWSLEWGVELA